MKATAARPTAAPPTMLPLLAAPVHLEIGAETVLLAATEVGLAEVVQAAQVEVVSATGVTGAEDHEPQVDSAAGVDLTSVVVHSPQVEEAVEETLAGVVVVFLAHDSQV